MQFYRSGNQDLIHRNLKERAQCVQIIYGRKAFALLPLVDRPRLLKAEVALQIPNCQAAFPVAARSITGNGFTPIGAASFKRAVLQNTRDCREKQDLILKGATGQNELHADRKAKQDRTAQILRRKTRLMERAFTGHSHCPKQEGL